MTERRNRRRKRVLTYCPTCDERLWRVNSERHYLFASGHQQVQELAGITRKKALLLTCQRPTFVDRRSWLEEFFCATHGHIWLLLKQGEDGYVTATIPDPHVWEQTTGTIDPRKPNPSVSEYTFRASRRASCSLAHRFYEQS
ncbi:hypothetical protein [Anthocerotibacter panamensis]|uniref:hypothetical protein n=1 Tax=Anthocerotibacter panamensis TaxID=2857077 RepID=UPI001C407669|nr:hypothetical protein [Anthocerotibacter panamensis]